MKQFMFRTIFALFLMLPAAAMVFGQKKITVILEDSIAAGITFEKLVVDKSGVEQQALKIVSQLLAKGFVTASVDSINLHNDTARVKIYMGNRFSWGSVNFKYLPKPMLKQFGFEESTQGPISVESLKKSMFQTLSYFENRGYPFAYFYWDSLVVRKDTILGSLYFEKNILITFDTIALFGEAGVNKKFLYNYLGIKPGDAYNEALVLQVNDKLAKLPFTTLQNKPLIYFVGRKAILVLNLKKRRTDRLDGLIGFAPNTGTPGNTNLLVTGEFHLDFKNLKGSGKGFKADWQSFKARSQTLNIGLNLPYIFNQPIGSEVSVDFLKYDTIYTETRFQIAAQYIFSGLDHAKLFYEQKTTNLQYADTLSVRSSKALGQLTSMRTSRYGIGFNSITFDNRISPRKGYLADMDVSIINRVILRDDRINRVKFYNSKENAYYTVYDSMKLKTNQFMIQFALAKPFQVLKRVVIYNELRGNYFFSPSIYFNELYRFGGNNTFKGFNEQALFASSLSIFNLEVRYLLSENSFLRLFGNVATYTDKSVRTNKISSDQPYGFGGGINLETGGGIFNISVALGKSKFNPIDFKNAKVHFGLINYF
jgi:hypothetical protein